jgi:hypothetical protein
VRPPKLPLLGGLSLLCALALTACGGGGGHKPTTTQARPGLKANADAPPVPTDNAKDLLQRLQGAATASSCDPIRGILHSYYGTVTETACRAIQAQLTGFHSPHAQTYGLGALVSYQDANDRPRTAVFALDADRRYRLVYIETGGGPGAGNAPGPAFASTATSVIAALRDGDCDALLRAIDRGVGLGVGPDRKVCMDIGASLLRREILDSSTVKTKLLGGTGQVAFVQLHSAPGRYYTMVLRRIAPAAGSSAPARTVLVNAIPAV